MAKLYYKAVRLDRTSHHDHKTKWRVGSVVRPDRVDDGSAPCGHGIHCSPTLLHAVSYQQGPSRYYEVEPIRICGDDHTKARCEAVRVVRELSRREQDELSGFRLYEANHPVNPLLVKRRMPLKRAVPLVTQWAGVWDGVRASWYGGYVPSFDGTTLRLHAGPNADIVWEGK